MEPAPRPSPRTQATAQNYVSTGDQLVYWASYWERFDFLAPFPECHEAQQARGITTGGGTAESSRASSAAEPPNSEDAELADPEQGGMARPPPESLMAAMRHGRAWQVVQQLLVQGPPGADTRHAAAVAWGHRPPDVAVTDQSWHGAPGPVGYEPFWTGRAPPAWQDQPPRGEETYLHGANHVLEVLPWENQWKFVRRTLAGAYRGTVYLTTEELFGDTEEAD